MPTPKNVRGQSPSRTPRESAKRLEEKAKKQSGRANKARTTRKIQADLARSGRSR